MSYTGGLRVAEYTDFHLTSNCVRPPDNPDNEKLTQLITDRGVVYDKLASVYVELPHGERYLLQDLPEHEVSKYFVRDDDAPPGVGDCYANGPDKWTFIYRQGVLFCATLESTDAVPIGFSASKEGPYVKLPITRRTMVEMFGEPVKWGSYHPASGP